MKAAKREEERGEGKEELARGGKLSGHAKKMENEEKKRRHEKRAHGGALSMHGRSPIHDKKERGHEKVAVTKKAGGKVEGKKAHHHLGRRARGGRMTPASPLSGADTGHLPYMSEHRAEAPLQAKIKQPVRGHGKDKTGPYASGG